MKRFCLLIILFSSSIFVHAQKSLIGKADTLFFKGDYKSSIPLYKKGLESDPKNALAWNRLGYCSHQIGKLDDAITQYNTSLENNPGGQLKFTVESRLARAYSLKNDKAKAIEFLDKAIASGYGNINELETNKDFDGLRKEVKFTDLQRKVYEKAYPCSTDPKRREFDFWIGEWDVYNLGGQLVGRSSIQNASGGCMILENWSSVNQTYTGKSINFYNQDTGKWEQHWVGSSGDVGINPDGVFKDGVMRFTKETKDNSGKAALTNFSFHNLGPDKVRQHLEKSTDNGATWQTSFDYTYVRRK